MKPKKSNPAETHYYSDRILRKLEKLRFTSFTLIEAPSGYGKTTAIKYFLETRIPQNTPVYWFTAIEETPATGIMRFYRLIDKIDSYAGERLIKIGLPNATTIGEVCDALRTIQCRHETYLVIDNFHLLRNVLMPAFLKALIDHEGKHLHIIIITQMLGRDLHMTIAGRGFLHITASDLRLDANDIRSYYALANVNISKEDAQRVESYTEGWIIAVYLQLRAFQETGSFSNISILSLIEDLVWNMMTKEQQVFLMYLSSFETITYQQACVLMSCESLPVYAQEALKNPFISYERVGQQYELHNNLSELLKQKRQEQGKAFGYECLLKAGDLYRDEGRIAEALSFYWQIKDYERMLALDCSTLILEEIGNVPFSDIALDIAENCPDYIKRGYPLSMLRIGWTLLTYGFYSAFNELMEYLRDMLDSEDREDSLILRGEWLLLSSFNHYPKMDDMIMTLNKADELFKGKTSRVILPTFPWWLGTFSLLDFHITPGKSDEEGDMLEKYVALFSKLTNGSSSGGDVLYRATLAYHRGDIILAETLAYKAVYLSENKKQNIVQLGATLQLAQVALHKEDIEGWYHAINSMERAASNPLQNTFVLRSTLDIMRGLLLVELQQLEGIADWLKEGDFSLNRVLPQMLSLALFVHGLYLLFQGKAPQLIGLIEANLAKESMNKPVSKLLLTMDLAAAYLHIGNRDKAVELVQSIAKIVMPDGLIATFASFSWLLEGITDDIVKNEYPELYDRFKETKDRFGSGWNKLYNDMSPEELPLNLTDREREIALLAADGLRNSEIAEKLFISESTVRTHMRTIFKKLDIDRRVKLAEKLK